MAQLKAWRLSKQRYANAAFSGDGPRLFGGRWNPVGVPMIYASVALSLAVLEVFVHMEPLDEPEEYASIAADTGIDESAAGRIHLRDLPKDWKRINHPELLRIGEEWVRCMRSLVLLVPSVIVEEEWNILINPLHPDARKLILRKPKPFYFDERMFRVTR